MIINISNHTTKAEHSILHLATHPRSNIPPNLMTESRNLLPIHYNRMKKKNKKKTICLNTLITQNNSCQGKNHTGHSKEEQCNKISSRPFSNSLAFNSQTLSSPQRINFFQQIKLNAFLLQFLNTFGQQFPIFFLSFQ